MENKDMKLERMLITCGGTGGHFYPGLAIAKAMQKQGGEVKLLLAGNNASAQKMIAAEQGVDSVLLPPMPSPGKSPVAFAAGTFKGYFICRKEIKKFHPQALLGMGAFTSLPAVIAAKTAGLPIYLHDGNAKAGRANRILSQFARFLGTAFPLVNPEKIKCPVLHTGMPVRESLCRSAEQLTKSSAISELNSIYGKDLDPSLPTILIFGGSQGAAVFNAALPEALLQLNTSDIQVLHLTGRGKLDSTVLTYKDAKFRHLVTDTSEKMELFWSASDMVFSRAGGSSVAELALFGRPAVLIPYPFAAEDHQRFNARYFADSNAGSLLDNYDLSPESARNILTDFLANPELWAERGVNAKKLAKPAAAEDILHAITVDLNS